MANRHGTNWWNLPLFEKRGSSMWKRPLELMKSPLFELWCTAFRRPASRKASAARTAGRSTAPVIVFGSPSSTRGERLFFHFQIAVPLRTEMELFFSFPNHRATTHGDGTIFFQFCFTMSAHSHFSVTHCPHHLPLIPLPGGSGLRGLVRDRLDRSGGFGRAKFFFRSSPIKSGRVIGEKPFLVGVYQKVNIFIGFYLIRRASQCAFARTYAQRALWNP